MAVQLKRIAKRESSGLKSWPELEIPNIDLLGGQARPSEEFFSAVSTIGGELSYPGYMRIYGKKQQPLHEKQIRDSLEKLVRKEEVHFSEAYRETTMLDTAKIMEYWLDIYESLRDDTLTDKADRLLGKIKGKSPIGIKQLIETMQFGMEKAFHPYRRPENISGMFPENVEQLLVAAYYKYKTKDSPEAIGTTTSSMMNYERLIKELGLFHDHDLLAFYLIDHELTHKRNPPPKGATSEELARYEQDIREEVYNNYVLRSEDPSLDTKKYAKLARIAQAFACGNNGVGALSYIPNKRLAEKKALDACIGRDHPDAIGDELYSGPTGFIDDAVRQSTPSAGSNKPEFIMKYSKHIGHPLPELEVGGSQKQHKPAQHKPGTKTTPQYKEKTYCPAETCSARTEHKQHQAAQYQPGEK